MSSLYSLGSAPGPLEESRYCRLLSAPGVGAGGGVCAVHQVQER